ncbi:MAG: hypothetical protein LBM12_01080 [Candidatus Nomurabacteria bacterium]|nr:hypothetical protein [Candidatus Nomurabacteria bacterium]
MWSAAVYLAYYTKKPQSTTLTVTAMLVMMLDTTLATASASTLGLHGRIQMLQTKNTIKTNMTKKITTATKRAIMMMATMNTMMMATKKTMTRKSIATQRRLQKRLAALANRHFSIQNYHIL